MIFFKDFFSFIKQPSLYQEGEYLSPSKSLKFLISAFSVVIIVEFLVWLIRLSLLTNDYGVLPTRLNPAHSINLIGVFLIVFYTPILEELTFRLGLRFSKMNVVFSFSFLFSLITKLVASRIHLQYTNVFLSYFIFDLLLFFGFFIINYCILWPYFNRFIVKLFAKSFNKIVFSMVLVFALLHLNNFDYTKFSFSHCFYLSIFLLNMVFSGFVLSFLRLRCGMTWGITLHILINSFALRGTLAKLLFIALY
jgi:hypothetical protein